MSRTSVLINNYNNAPFLCECVDSVLNQSRPADEVIVYDDGSTDGSIAMLRGFGARITVIEGRHAPNVRHRESQARAIAQAFWRSAGDVIFLLDGDDFFLPEKIDRYVSAFEKNPGAVLVQAPMNIVHENGAPLSRRDPPLPPGADYKAATYACNDVNFYLPTSALAFRRDFLEKVITSALDFSDGHDLASDIRLAVIAPLFGSVIALDTPLTAWRRHPGAYSVRNQIRLSAESLKRARYFNAFCGRRGFPKISPWRNRRFYLQLARRVAPACVGNWWLRRFPRLARPKKA